MKIFECKCGSKDIFIKDSGNNKGLYCADCGKWMQWLGKDDLRLAERQIEQSIVNPIPRNIDELKNHDKQIRAETVDKCAELFAETLSNITNICGTNCPIKCNWGTEKTCKDMCKKWFEEKLKEQNK